MKIQLRHSFEEIISLENLLAAWKEFLKGKRDKKDAQEFGFHLMDNVLDLHRDLLNHTYRHGGYQAFNISDPKPRNIHKASVRDRLLHHAIYRILYPFFERTFIADSFSCRKHKGVHKALNRFREFGRKASKNNTRTVWVLKMDIRKFFASIDHKTLLNILAGCIFDNDIVWLLEKVIESFSIHPSLSPPIKGGELGVGLPFGNLTSQLFCNVYMNELDQFVKHKLRVKFYIRYADDFVIFSQYKSWLIDLVTKINRFLRDILKLEMHREKLFLETLASGADFLGWIHFPEHRVLRKSTRERMFRGVIDSLKKTTLESYLGMLTHGSAYKLRKKLYRQYFLRQN